MSVDWDAPFKASDFNGELMRPAQYYADLANARIREILKDAPVCPFCGKEVEVNQNTSSTGPIYKCAKCKASVIKPVWINGYPACKLCLVNENLK
jgi:ribosomal protein L37AE/L43A